MRTLLNLGILLTLSAPVQAQSRKSPQKTAAGDVESILDRLEKRLLDQEGQILTFDEKESVRRNAPKQKKSKKADRSLRFKEARITSDLPGTKRLRELAALVEQLEEDVEKLANDVQSSKQKVMENAKIDNFVEIEAHLENPDKMSIRTLSVKLDGYEIYNINDASGLWMPSKKLPLYAGPMQPGQHDLEIEARLLMKEKQGLPINRNVYKVVNQKQKLMIPDGISKRKWVVELTSGNAAPKKQRRATKRKMKDEHEE